MKESLNPPKNLAELNTLLRIGGQLFTHYTHTIMRVIS